MSKRYKIKRRLRRMMPGFFVDSFFWNKSSMVTIAKFTELIGWSNFPVMRTKHPRTP